MTAGGPSVFVRARRLGPSLPFVKVCGLTRQADVDLAVACGASAVGFVFWSTSPRAVSSETAARLRLSVPENVLVVGVFVDEQADDVIDVVQRVRLDVAQLHGDEPVSMRATLPVPVIKAVVGGKHDEAWTAVDGPGVALLVDARDEARRGGTGQVADWDAAQRLASVRPVVLAGGLTSDNVADATRRVRPWRSTCRRVSRRHRESRMPAGCARSSTRSAPWRGTGDERGSR